MKKEKQNKTPRREYPNKSLQIIEDNRLMFYDKYKFHNTLKFVVFLLCLGVIIASIVVKSKLEDGGFSGLLLIPAVVALCGAYGYAIFVKKRIDKKMKAYFELYFNCVNEYALSEKGFSDIELQKPGKITLDEFNESLLYKNVVEAGSRGLTKFKYNQIEMDVVDCAGNIKDAKRIRPVFVGKMVRSKASYKGDKPVIVYLKGNDRALPPTNVSEIKLQEEDTKMVIYSDNKDYKKVLNSDVKKALNAIKTEEILVDVAVSIHNSKVFIMLGYDDPLMVLPLQSEFNPEPTEKYKTDIEAVAKLVEALNK